MIVGNVTEIPVIPVIDIRTRKPLDRSAIADQGARRCEPIDVLTACLENVKSLEAVCVLTKDKEGTLGFISSIEGLAENVLFMELVRVQAMFAESENTNA